MKSTAACTSSKLKTTLFGIKIWVALLIIGINILIITTEDGKQRVFAAGTPSPDPDPYAVNESAASQNVITVLSPGPFSQVLSPIPITAKFDLVQAKTIRLDLLEANGEVISRKVYSLRTCSDQEQTPLAPLILDTPLVTCFQPQAEIITSLSFLIDQETQKGYLQIGIFDDKHRLRSLETVELQIFSQGKSKLLPPPSSNQRLTITSPTSGTEIRGGKISVEGEAPQGSSLPLRVSLITEDGQVIGSRMASVMTQGKVSSSGSQGGVFSVEVPYRLKQPKHAIISVALYSEAIKGPFLLTSQEIYLSP